MWRKIKLLSLFELQILQSLSAYQKEIRENLHFLRDCEIEQKSLEDKKRKALEHNAMSALSNLDSKELFLRILSGNFSREVTRLIELRFSSLEEKKKSALQLHNSLMDLWCRVKIKHHVCKKIKGDLQKGKIKIGNFLEEEGIIDGFQMRRFSRE